MSITAILRWVTLASILFWLIVYWQGGRKVIVDITEALRTQKSRLDLVLLIVLTLCSFVLIGLGFLTSFGQLQIVVSQNSMVVFIGTCLSISGIAGMFYCRHYLGKFWTAETNLSSDHQIIDTGPYRLVRHPIYTFAILMYIGFGLVFLSQWSILLAGIIIAAYILKTKDEDSFFREEPVGISRIQITRSIPPGSWLMVKK